MSFGNEVAEVLAIMRREKRLYKNYLPREAVDAGRKMMKKVGNLWEDVQESIFKMIKEEIPYESSYGAVWWYSVLLGIKKDSLLFYEFIKYVRQNKAEFSINTQCFLYYQLSGFLFLYPELSHMENQVELWKFYQEILEGFAEKIQTPLLELPINERNENLVIVVTEQFLDSAHGPTKTALDRCKTLIKEMGKEVILMNSKEMLNREGEIPFYGMRVGRHKEEKVLEEVQLWKGAEVPYYQCRSHMPDVDEIDHVLKGIRHLAPGWVVLIGGGGILGGLMGRMAPSIAVGTVPSELSITSARYQTLGRNLEERDLPVLEETEYKKEHVIESIFTSSLKTQTEYITRKELGNGVPEQAFLMIVVGARLNHEMTDTFLGMLEEILQGDMYVGFLGEFDKYEERMAKFPNLRAHSSYFGFCDDILSRIELCDLYINPIRKGGGTSSVEAMFQGVPVVTVDYGDVSINAGKEFCVKNYKEMQEKIFQYYRDREYYKLMSEKAKNRSEILLDTEKEFVRIMEEAEKREKQRTEKEE